MSKKYKPAWFPHDYNSRNDTKLVSLRREYGMEGIGIFWTLVEIMYENNGYISENQIADIAFEIRIKEKKLLDILQNYSLFETCFLESDSKVIHYFSNSILERLGEKKQKSISATNSINKRWENHTNVLRTNNERNTIRVDKSIEDKSIVDNKEKSKKENAPAALSLSYENRCKLFQDELRPFLSEYPREMLNDFYRYWVEPNKKGKMRWELEKTWRLDLRLKTWHDKGYKNYEKKSNSLEDLYSLPEEERNKRILKMFEDSEKQENELEVSKIN